MTNTKSESPATKQEFDLGNTLRKNRYSIFVIIAYISVSSIIIIVTDHGRGRILSVLWLTVGLIFLVVLIEFRRKQLTYNVKLRAALDRNDKRAADRISRSTAASQADVNRLLVKTDSLYSDLTASTYAHLLSHDLKNRERFRILNKKLDLVRSNSKIRSERLSLGQINISKTVNSCTKVSSAAITDASNLSSIKAEQLKNFLSAALAIQRVDNDRFQNAVLDQLNIDNTSVKSNKESSK